MDANRKEILIYRAWKLRLLLGLAAAVVLVGGWELYHLGRSRAGGDLDSLYAERDHLQEQISGLHARNADLERQIAMLERASQVDQQAYAVFTQERSNLQSEIKGLREELAFYRGVLSPDQEKIGLHAQDFSVQQALGSGRFHYRFVLTQSGRKDQVAKGVVHMFVEGLQDGAVKRLSLTELTSDERADIPYRFRYFQTIEGDVQLPEGFVTERAVVQAVPASAPRLPLEWTFDWPPDSGGIAEES